jgi:hypothetical protein
VALFPRLPAFQDPVSSVHPDYRAGNRARRVTGEHAHDRGHIVWFDHPAEDRRAAEVIFPLGGQHPRRGFGAHGTGGDGVDGDPVRRRLAEPSVATPAAALTDPGSVMSRRRGTAPARSTCSGSRAGTFTNTYEGTDSPPPNSRAAGARRTGMTWQRCPISRRPAQSVLRHAALRRASGQPWTWGATGSTIPWGWAPLEARGVPWPPVRTSTIGLPSRYPPIRPRWHLLQHRLRAPDPLGSAPRPSGTGGSGERGFGARS